MAQKPLFTLEVPPCDPHPGGTITATTPHADIYLVTLNCPPDNRLTTPVCQTLHRALDLLELSHPPGVVVTTSAIPKFFSNGLDLDHAQDHADTFWTDALYPLWKRFLTFPWPTVALINGHAFAGGLMTAMFHDYRVMNPSRGYVCLNELDFGAILPAPMSCVFREKVSPQTYRSLVLEARRFAGPEALEAGVVDAVGGWEEVVEMVGKRKLGEKGKSGVYGFMKAEMYRLTIGHLDSHAEDSERNRRLVEADEERVEKGKRKVEGWLAKAKL